MRMRGLIPVLALVVLTAAATPGCKWFKGASEEEAAPATADDEPAEVQAPATKPGSVRPGPGARPTPAPAAVSPVPAPVPAAAPATSPAPAVVADAAPAPVPAPIAPPVPARGPLPDVRLLLTAKDIASVAGEKVAFRRVPLPGIPTTDDQDALYFEPEKGANFGFAIEVFRGRDQEAVRERYAAMLASYPSATEIAPVAGKTFFAYWDEVLFVTFIQQPRNLVFVLSCGRKFCDSDKLYELARKVGSRSS